MYGAILGDMIGAPYEFAKGKIGKNFPLFTAESRFTDDTVLTIAVADALLKVPPEAPGGEMREELIDALHRWGSKYPHAGYGSGFRKWLKSGSREPYYSCGNGSAMRVSAAGWLYDDLATTRVMAARTALITHNHPKGVKGAEATASAIFLARNGADKDGIRAYITDTFDYDLSLTCAEIRRTDRRTTSCQRTVPEAITAFLEGESLEDVIRTAVSLGGDCDTLGCIAGSIAEAYYGVPAELVTACRKRLPADLLAVLDRFVRQSRPAGPICSRSKRGPRDQTMRAPKGVSDSLAILKN